jgi:signal transduction histidine kinase
MRHINYWLFFFLQFSISYFGGSFGYAQNSIDSLEKVNRQYAQQDTQKVYLLTELARNYCLYAYKIDTAVIYADNALTLAQRLPSKRMFGYALDTKGVVERSIGHFDSSLMYHKKALMIANQVHDYYLQLIANNNIGVAYRRMGNNVASLEYHLDALRIAEANNHTKGMSYSLNSLGNLYYYLKDYDKALYHFRRGLVLDELMKNPVGLAINYNNVGNIYRQRLVYDSAELYLQKSLKINKEINNFKGIAICYDDLGHLYLKTNRLEEAREYLRRALRIALNSKDRIYIARIYMHLGLLYVALKEPQEALYYLKQAIVTAERIGAKQVIQESYENISIAYEQLKEYKKSLENYKKFMQYQDTLLIEDTKKHIAFLEEKFKQESKDDKIKLLMTEQTLKDALVEQQRFVGIALIVFIVLILITLAIYVRANQQKLQANQQLLRQQEALLAQKNEIELQKESLNRSNAVKDQLFSIIGHDLRSPFNTLKGFIQILKMGGMTLNDVIHIAASMETQLNYTLLLLNNLLLWSKSQLQGMTPQPSQFDLQEVVAQNMALLSEGAKKKNITLQNHLPEYFLVLADRDMIDTVVRNLLSNAIKFTLEGGSVNVEYENHIDEYHICIQDTGIGMTDKQLHNLFTTKLHSTLGTANEKGTGLGLMICKDFVEQNGGKIWVKSQIDKGSRFCFSIKKTHS